MKLAFLFHPVKDLKESQLSFVKEPYDIPPGRYAIFTDDANNAIRIIDLTKNEK